MSATEVYCKSGKLLQGSFGCGISLRCFAAAPADQPGPFEYDQMLGHRLAGEGHLAGQPTGADVTVADEEVEDPAASVSAITTATGSPT